MFNAHHNASTMPTARPVRLVSTQCNPTEAPILPHGLERPPWTARDESAATFRAWPLRLVCYGSPLSPVSASSAAAGGQPDVAEFDVVRGIALAEQRASCREDSGQDAVAAQFHLQTM